MGVITICDDALAIADDVLFAGSLVHVPDRPVRRVGIHIDKLLLNGDVVACDDFVAASEEGRRQHSEVPFLGIDDTILESASLERAALKINSAAFESDACGSHVSFPVCASNTPTVADRERASSLLPRCPAPAERAA